MRKCDKCGASISDTDLFCATCGAKQTGAAGSPQASAPESGGSPVPLPSGAGGQSGIPSPVPSVANAATEPMQVPGDGMTTPSSSAGAPPMSQAIPGIGATAGSSPARNAAAMSDLPGDPAALAEVEANNKKARTVVIVVAIIAAVCIVLGLVMAATGGNKASSSYQNASASRTSSSGGDEGSASSSGQSNDDDCVTAPKATVDKINHEDTTLLVDLDLTSGCASGEKYKRSDTTVMLKADSYVVAIANFDFSRHPVKFDDDSAQVTLAFSDHQYWRPYDEIGNATALFETHGQGVASDPNGDKAPSVTDAISGEAVNAQRYPHYTQRGFDAQYYVLLSGESFGDVNAANAWCSANGYGRSDCIGMKMSDDGTDE